MREPSSPPIGSQHASGAFSRCFRQRDVRRSSSNGAARRGERVPRHMRTHVLGDSRAVGHRLDDVLGTTHLDRERLPPREIVLQERPHAVRPRHHANLGLTAVRTALDLDPELALLPEDVF